MTEDLTATAGRSPSDVVATSTEILQREVNAQLVLATLHAHDARLDAETRLKTLQRLGTIFDEAPSAICLLRGPDLTIDLVNPSLLELWGRTSAITGRALLDAVPELRGQPLDVLVRRVLETGAAAHGKEVVTRLDRSGDGALSDTYLDLAIVPLRDDEGSAVFVHAYDVTDKVVARRNAEALQRDAEAANRFKDEFLATMSHELRTPLTAILGWSSLLRRGSYDALATDRALASIERSARTQTRLIDDLLDVSRIMSGKLRLELCRVDIDAIVKAAVDVLLPVAEAKRVRLTVDLGPQEGAELLADAERLQQVVWNLVNNAIKFTPAGGDVAFHVERVRGVVRFVVRDTGAGIAAEHLPFIFERFRQVDSTATRRHGGLGLGLAIVRHLVELHGGSVGAASEGPGRGATFTVRIPVRPVGTVVDAESEPALLAAPITPPDLSGVAVLVVDDDDDSRDLIRSALECMGARVIAVPSARDAFEHVQKNSLDVMVSDIGMPDEDGFSLMQRVRALPPEKGGQIRAIALTAFARKDDALRARAVGFQLHLAKPVDPDELTSSVMQLLLASR